RCCRAGRSRSRPSGRSRSTGTVSGSVGFRLPSPSFPTRWPSWCPRLRLWRPGEPEETKLEPKGGLMTEGLLLLHAFPLDASMWEPQVRAVTGVPVVAPNLPGFGGAPPAGPVMTMDAAADAAADAATAAGVDRVVVCGLSMGGYVALA